MISPPQVQSIQLLPKEGTPFSEGAPLRLPSISGTMIRSMGEPQFTSSPHAGGKPVNGNGVKSTESEKMKVQRDIRARMKEQEQAYSQIRTEGSPLSKVPLNVLLTNEANLLISQIGNQRMSNPGNPLPTIENSQQFWANGGRRGVYVPLPAKRKKSKRREPIVNSLETESIGEMLRMSRILPSTSKARSSLKKSPSSSLFSPQDMNGQQQMGQNPQFLHPPRVIIEERMRPILGVNSARQSVVLPHEAVVQEQDDQKWNTTPDLLPNQTPMRAEDVRSFLNDIVKNSPSSLPEDISNAALLRNRLLRNMRQGARDLSETKKLLLSLNQAGLVKNLQGLLNSYQRDSNRRNFDLIHVRKGLQATQLRRLKETSLKGDAERSEYYEGFKMKGESPSVTSKVSHFSQRTNPSRVKNIKLPRHALYSNESSALLTPQRTLVLSQQQQNSPELRIQSQPLHLPRLRPKNKQKV